MLLVYKHLTISQKILHDMNLILKDKIMVGSASLIFSYPCISIKYLSYVINMEVTDY